MLPNLICQLPRKKFIFVRTLIKFNKCIPSGQTILNERHEKRMQKFKYLTKETLLSLRILKVSIVSGSSLCSRSFWARCACVGIGRSSTCPFPAPLGWWVGISSVMHGCQVVRALSFDFDETALVCCERGPAVAPSHAVSRNIYYFRNSYSCKQYRQYWVQRAPSHFAGPCSSYSTSMPTHLLLVRSF